MKYDLVLLHPPSIYDFRTKSQIRGPISDVIPSSSIFDMYPIGLTSIAGYLEQFGYKVKIVNLAARMLRDREFDVENKIRSLQSSAFGIDLHWLPHAQGSIEIAKLVKKYHPDIPVIFGGLSATYYHNELMGYRCVDFVVRGDSTEKPMLRLMDEIKTGGMNLSSVPSLTWKRSGEITVNPLSPPPANLDDVSIPDYRYAVRSVFKYRSLLDVVPYDGWLKYPSTALLTVRGCTQNCSLCGGSSSAYASNCERPKPAMRSPAKLIEDIEFIQRFSRTPIFVIGDIRQGGTNYVDEFLERVARIKPKNELVFELFWTAGDEFFSKIQRAVPKFSLEITLESADEGIRRANGKFPGSNHDVVRTIHSALANGCRKLDVFFMVGLPHQTRDSALANIDFCEEIHKACGFDKRLFYFVAPLAPFLDPASRAFEDPEKFGLKRLATTLEEHIRLLTGPTWEQVLNYETDKMNREQIVTTMYASLEKLNDFKLKYVLINLDAHRKIAVETRAVAAWMERIRNAVRAGTRFENLPVFEEPTGSATRTQSELRWKVKRLYPHLLSFVSIGFMSLLDELRAIALRRQSRWKYAALRSVNDPDSALARAEPEPDPEPLGLTGN
jgi:B12-binding domain/radical SAM domain protein